MTSYTCASTVPPGAPRTLSIESIGATSIRVHWEAPIVVISPISYYLITAHNLNNAGELDTVTNTTTHVTISSVTGLLPGTTYELTVVAVSHGGDVMGKSEPSESVVAETATLTGECWENALCSIYYNIMLKKNLSKYTVGAAHSCIILLTVMF